MSSIEAANLFNVKGLVAVITGGGSGIGLMMAKALEANGAAKVYIIGRRQEVLDEAAKQAKHGNIVPIQGDVSSKEDLQRAAAIIQKDIGYVNVLIANQGKTGPGVKELKKDASLEEFQDFLWNMPAEDFTSTLETNTTATFYSVVAFLKLLDEGNKKGNMGLTKSQVIATSSISSYSRVITSGYAYSASKAAVTHLMKAMATNLVPYDIRSNVIMPGVYPSDITAAMFGSMDAVMNTQFPRSAFPAQRSGYEEDMAGVVLFLTSRAGAYCNGNVLVTDGGRLGIVPASY
ncbi:NAD(P)-binding protein [Xylona heveae TC161]|uniref:NAD(P)-binding protein n=1 Tax=Xylona heveae (strain CBS 132557 / TC161) TaxID=1328760 RepID=A0A165FIX3_XYLHT|nr:NAD(P)-binding protein [Xylona heveae TC161]KZF21030.1 NAD(P)-binding protein [Xylona heveae TC161]